MDDSLVLCLTGPIHLSCVSTSNPRWWRGLVCNCMTVFYGFIFHIISDILKRMVNGEFQFAEDYMEVGLFIHY